MNVYCRKNALGNVKCSVQVCFARFMESMNYSVTCVEDSAHRIALDERNIFTFPEGV
jgi:hypothetical protein